MKSSIFKIVFNVLRYCLSGYSQYSSPTCNIHLSTLSTRLSTRNSRLFNCSTHLSTCSTHLSTCVIYLSTRNTHLTIRLRTRSTCSTICQSLITDPPQVLLEKGVLKICSKFTGEHPCESVTSIKLQSSFIEITIRHGCSPVNLLHISEHFWSAASESTG